MKPVLLAALVALGGCSSYADRVSATCSRFGAGPGTSHYRDCIEQQQAIDAHDRAMWGGVTASGAALLAPQPSSTVFIYGR